MSTNRITRSQKSQSLPYSSYHVRRKTIPIFCLWSRVTRYPRSRTTREVVVSGCGDGLSEKTVAGLSMRALAPHAGALCQWFPLSMVSLQKDQSLLADTKTVLSPMYRHGPIRILKPDFFVKMNGGKDRINPISSLLRFPSYTDSSPPD